jgi:hypothetical protein
MSVEKAVDICGTYLRVQGFVLSFNGPFIYEITLVKLLFQLEMALICIIEILK